MPRLSLEWLTNLDLARLDLVGKLPVSVVPDLVAELARGLHHLRPQTGFVGGENLDGLTLVEVVGVLRLQDRNKIIREGRSTFVEDVGDVRVR